jgi:CRISPR-associated protein Cmr3
MIHYRFLEPLDVLFLRGNRLFGEPGSFGEGLMPPWPSVAAGALRSAILVRDGVDLAEFAAGRRSHPELGSPEAPGPFAVAAFHLARRRPDGTVEVLFAPPADLVIGKGDDGSLSLSPLRPVALADGLQGSAPLARVAVLAESHRSKPAGGYWLTQGGWAAYLRGEVPGPQDLVEQSGLWRTDPRVGVGLDPERHRADDGKLFSPQALAPCAGVGFLVGVIGAEPPASGTLRLGGDGRGCALSAAPYTAPGADLGALTTARRCRLVLTAPGLFAEGWRLPGLAADGTWGLDGVRGRVVCAAVPRAEVVSGWDLAKWQPKAAQRAAPSGSVYWIEDLEADPESLGKLAAGGLWGAPCEDPQRRAEGFNTVALAAWSTT